jgi:hypothetical protein
MKDRFNRAKQYVSNHKVEIVLIAGVATLGTVMGSKLSTQHTFLNITEEQLTAMITDPRLHMVWDAPGRHTIHLQHIPS